MTMAYDSAVFRKVLKTALVPVLDGLKQSSQCGRKNFFFSPFLTQQIAVIGFRHPQKLDDITAQHQRKNANDPVPVRNGWGTKPEILPIGSPPGACPGKSLKNLRSAVVSPQALPIRRNLLQFGKIG